MIISPRLYPFISSMKRGYFVKDLGHSPAEKYQMMVKSYYRMISGVEESLAGSRKSLFIRVLKKIR